MAGVARSTAREEVKRIMVVVPVSGEVIMFAPRLTSISMFAATFSRPTIARRGTSTSTSPKTRRTAAAAWSSGATVATSRRGRRKPVSTTYPKGQGASAFINDSVLTLGANTQIPSLLFATAGLVSTLGELADMTAAGTEAISARLAHKLTGIARSTYGQTAHVSNVRRTAVWIDAETLLVRRIFEDTPKGTVAGSRRRITTSFEPQANPTLEDSRFTFVVPSLQK